MTKRWRIVVAGLALALAGGGAYFAFRPRSIEPPAIDTSSLDPVVAKAIDAARAGVRAEPKSARKWGELGTVLFAQTMYPEAGTCFAEAERLDPRDARWPYLQAIGVMQDDPTRALAHLDRAIERAGAEIAPRLRRAEILLALERWDDARQAFDEIRQRKPDLPRAALGLGQVAIQVDDWQRAEEFLTPLLADPTTRHTARRLLVEMAARRGDSAKLARHRAALEELPPDIGWDDPYMEPVQKQRLGLKQRLTRAGELIARNRLPDAKAELDELIRTYPNSEDAYLILGKLHIAAGDPAQAEVAMRKCLDLSPENVPAHLLLGAARFDQKNYPGAEQTFRATLRLQPDHAAAHFYLAQCRLKQADRAGAIESLRQAVRYRPNMAEAHSALALELLEAGDRANAKRHAEDALRLKPDDADAKRVLEATAKRG